MESEKNDTEKFIPKGAMAFFVVLMLFFLLTWFTLYYELLSRG